MGVPIEKFLSAEKALKMTQGQKSVLFIGLLLFMMGVFVFAFIPRLSVGLIELNCEGCSTADAIQVAGQIGRLDVVTFALSILGIGVAFFAVFSYFDTKAESIAESTKASQKLLDDWYTELNKTINDQIEVKVAANLSQYDIKKLNLPDVGDFQVTDAEEARDDQS